MAEAETIDEAPEQEPPPRRRRNFVWKGLRWVGYLIAAILALLLLTIAFLHTPPGRQFIVDQIAKFAPASGLSVEVGSIEGSVLWSATFKDVRFRDANNTLFLEVPEIDLNWRPHNWFSSGLDVRHLVLHDGTLHAFPELLPGDPDAPILPDFDIRADRLVIDNLTVAEGLLGEERVIDFAGRVDIRDGRVFLDADGEFGGGDEFSLLVDAEPDRDRFELDLDWRAPAGGFLAGMVGAEEDLAVAIEGKGTWTSWEGALVAVQDGEQLLDFEIYNQGGQYRLVGEARPGDYLSGLPAEALGEVVALNAMGTLEDSVLEGVFTLQGAALEADGEGAIDLANNAFVGLQVRAVLLDPTLFTEGIALNDAVLEAVLDGPFSDFDVPHELRVARVDAGDITLDGVVQRGTLSYTDTRFVLPLNAAVNRVVTGNELADPRLINGRIDGTLIYTGSQLLSDNLAIRFPGLNARLALQGNLETGRFRLEGPVNVSNLALEGLGRLDGGATIRFAIGGGAPWTLRAQAQGRVDQITNSTLANLAGETIAFRGSVSMSETGPIEFNAFNISGSRLEATLDGRIVEGATTLAGTGTHVEYGAFTIEATLTDEGPRAELVFADPFPAAGLTDVRVTITPTDDGFRIETSGGSMLGAFDGLLDLSIGPGGEVTIDVTSLEIAESRVTGQLRLVEGGVAGTLDIERGGLDGTIELATRNGGQAFDVMLTADGARLGDLYIARGNVDATGFIGGGSTTIQGSLTAQGVSYGSIFIGRVAAQAEVVDGVGSFDAAIAGRRGSRFELLLNGQIAPERIAVAAQGSYAGREITMPRRAVLLATEDGGWRLQRTQIGYGGGFAILRGRFGGDEPAQGRLSLSELPLSLLDVVLGDLGFGGTISGIVEFRGANGGPMTGEARVLVNDLARASPLLTSRPMDLAAVIRLTPDLLQARAVMEEERGANGRLDARIANLPRAGGLTERLYAGDLFAQLRYDGPASALWRLAAIELIDITGDIQIAANARGTLQDPQVRGTLGGDDLRVQSALTGTSLTDVSAIGRFNGSRLQLTRFAGEAPNGGQVVGSGFIDLANMTRGRGPQIDLRLGARNARILALEGMSATVTGPMRIVSSGIGGTIAGRLQIEQAEWRLGGGEVTEELPNVEITEVNRPAETAPITPEGQPWRYLIDATADGGIEVDGMGLESEWRADILLRGTTADPRIGGEARIVPRQSFYSFAGVRFEITRGRIDFDEQVPIDPRIDLVAETDVNGVDVAVSVEGSASRPEITFSSTPALPEEELLAQLLFGGSITELSATDALQLGAALASLRGGSGVGPINKLRDAIGLDRLRIVPADPALDRGTSVALGKNVTRDFFVEIVTDGQGYNASQLEYRVTSWLSLLATVSTIGRHSASAQYRRDY